MEWIATLGGDVHVMMMMMMIVLLTLILSYRSVLRSLKVQRRLEQVGHVESVDNVPE